MSCHNTAIPPPDPHHLPPPTKPAPPTRCTSPSSLLPWGYISLLTTNRNFRLYLLSHICQHAGDWFVHVANIITIERLAPGSGRALSILSVTANVPEMFLTPIGGILADVYDRRRVMITIDLLGSLAVLGFVWSLRVGSIGLFFAVSTLRCCLHALYEPSTKSMVPLLVGEDVEDMKRATTLCSMAWSSLMIVGGVMGGWASNTIGLQACYVVDSISYLISTLLMLNVTGKYVVNPQNTTTKTTSTTFNNNHTTTTTTQTPPPSTHKKKSLRRRLRTFLYLSTIPPLLSIYHILSEFSHYLAISSWSLLILLKFSGALTWGAEDIIIPEFSHVPNDEEATGLRVGLLYSYGGIGCLLGPIVVNGLVVGDLRVDGMLARLQIVVIGSLAVVALAMWGSAQASGREREGEDGSFGWMCFFELVRRFGTSVLYVDSSFLLQTLSSREMLGRILGLEHSLSHFAEAISALYVGHLSDVGYSLREISKIFSGMGFVLFILWATYHMLGGGAASTGVLVGRRNRRRLAAAADAATGQGEEGADGKTGDNDGQFVEGVGTKGLSGRDVV